MSVWKSSCNQGGAGGGGGGAVKVRVVRATTSWPVLGVWVAMSLLVATVATFSFLQPAWLVRNQKTSLTAAVALGAFSFCFRVEDSSWDESTCQVYAGSSSGAWQAACLLYGSGCVFLLCSGVVSVVCLALPTDRWRFLVSVAVGHAQAAAVMILVAAVLIFPLGFGAPLVRQFCGEDANLYDSGACALGWAYVLAIVSCLVAIYCPVLARFATYDAYEPVYWTTVCSSRTV